MQMNSNFVHLQLDLEEDDLRWISQARMMAEATRLSWQVSTKAGGPRTDSLVDMGTAESAIVVLEYSTPDIQIESGPTLM